MSLALAKDDIVVNNSLSITGCSKVENEKVFPHVLYNYNGEVDFNLYKYYRTSPPCTCQFLSLKLSNFHIIKLLHFLSPDFIYCCDKTNFICCDESTHETYFNKKCGLADNSIAIDVIAIPIVCSSDIEKILYDLYNWCLYLFDSNYQFTIESNNEKTVITINEEYDITIIIPYISFSDYDEFFVKCVPNVWNRILFNNTGQMILSNKLIYQLEHNIYIALDSEYNCNCYLIPTNHIYHTTITLSNIRSLPTFCQHDLLKKFVANDGYDDRSDNDISDIDIDDNVIVVNVSHARLLHCFNNIHTIKVCKLTIYSTDQDTACENMRDVPRKLIESYFKKMNMFIDITKLLNQFAQDYSIEKVKREMYSKLFGKRVTKLCFGTSKNQIDEKENADDYDIEKMKNNYDIIIRNAYKKIGVKKLRPAIQKF